VSIYLIGRDSTNDIVVNDRMVSRKHALLTQVSPNTFVLEDTNSSNRTFLDGVPIQRALITIEDNVSLGTVRLDLKAHFQRKLVELGNEDSKLQFEKLSLVWEGYLKAKKLVQTKQIAGRTAFSLAGMALATFFMPPMGGVMMAGSMLGTISFGLLKGDDEKMFVIEAEFKMNYICPKCKRFLGQIPFIKLKEIGKCAAPRCGKKWN